MKKFIKVSLIVVACLVVVGLVAGYFLLMRAPIPKDTAFTVDMDEVNKLATAAGGDLPTEVRALVVAEGTFPAWAVVAGGGGEKIPMIFAAYQIVYPGKTVVIDSTADRKGFEQMPFPLGSFDDAKYEALSRALVSASVVLITHEHFDHVGGIAASPSLNDVLPHLLLTEEQLKSSLMEEAGFPAGALEGFVPISYDRYYVAAPGIVLIKTPGHSPGGQMVYVVTKDGHEYLFVGDIVWSRENLKREANRPLLISLAMNEDLASARGEIRWIIDNLYANPDNTITYVVSHDRDQLNEYIDAGVIEEGFK
jgi:glyoxylase-like metal-dependent hydrolase (beta-lactamase superfamily II)